MGKMGKILTFATLSSAGLVWALPRMYHHPRRKFTKTPADLNIMYDDVVIPTVNDKMLHGWWIQSDSADGYNRPLIILMHGWGRTAERMLPCVKALYPEHYNLLAIDARNHGLSGGDGFSTMAKFGEDIQAAVQWAMAEKGIESGRIAVMGHSIGGAGTIYAASRNNNIKAIVTVGAFADPEKLMSRQYQEMLHLPKFPFIWLTMRYMEWHLGLKFRDIAPKNIISRIGGSVLIIHGDKDNVVPVEDAYLLIPEPNDRRQRWILEGKNHSDCSTYPGFWDRVISFFATALNQHA